MKKIDIKQEYMKIPKIEYDVYSQLNSSNLTNLNISNFAEMCKAYLLIPLNLNEEDNCHYHEFNIKIKQYSNKNFFN